MVFGFYVLCKQCIVGFPSNQSVFPRISQFSLSQSVFPLFSQFSLSHSVFPRISQFSLKSVSSLDLTGMLFSYHEQFRYVDYVLHCINDYGTCISNNYIYRLLKKNLHWITCSILDLLKLNIEPR